MSQVLAIRRRWATGGVALMAVLAFTIGADPSSAADPPDPSASGSADPFAQDMDSETLATMRRQEALQPAIAMIQNALAINDSGLASLAFEGDGIAIYWKGKVPPELTVAVEDARRIGSVVIRPARFSEAELTEQAAKISRVAELEGDLQSISLNYDGSGLTIEKLPAQAAAARSAKVGRTLRAIESIVAEARLTVPVKTMTGGPVELLDCSSPGCRRRDDMAPWNGGLYIRNPDSPVQPNWCTSAFGVRAMGEYMLMTAAHCGTYPDRFYDYVGEYVGWIVDEDWDKDIMLIRAPGYYRMWDGTPTTSTSKIVYAYANKIVGELLCQSGATSGTVCNMQTQSGTYSSYGCDSDGLHARNGEGGQAGRWCHWPGWRQWRSCILAERRWRDRQGSSLRAADHQLCRNALPGHGRYHCQSLVP
jgi:streptogrisin D